MSEIQNRAVQLLQLQHPSLNNKAADFRFQMLKASLLLYRSIGGSPSVGHELVREAFETDPGEVADCVGELMKAIAAVSHLQDLDMMQAAYNTLDVSFRRVLSLQTKVA